jgi:hypothetical protein
MTSKHEYFANFNPITARSAQEAKLFRAVLPLDVSVKIIPKKEKISINPLEQVALGEVGEGKVSLKSPKPQRVSATTSFIDVETKDGTVSVPVIPEPYDEPDFIKKVNPELIEIEERARHMRDAGPNPDLPI